MNRRLKRKLPVPLFVTGVFLFGGGYALLQHAGGIGPSAGLARLLFWCGLGLLIAGAGLWLSLPPQEPRPAESEEPEPDVLSESDEDDLIACPYCRQPIYEQSERCPRCGKYISLEDAPLVLPVWIAIGVGLALLVTVLWILSGQ